MGKQENINRIYEVFEKYTLNGKLDACPCGCISEKDENKLYSRNLKKLTEDDLAYYARKAITTWGNIFDYKDFLPRVLEIYSQKGNSGLIDLGAIYNKLEYGNWREWEEGEQIIIMNFVKSCWIESVNQKLNNDIYSDLTDFSCFFSQQELIELWNYPTNKIALRNFVNYFYHNGNYFIRKHCETELAHLLSKPNLIKELEKEFFRIESKDEEYSSEISVVLQLIESIGN
ncbi:hypothetical protein V9L05_02410 [Bernardetia sp. Wsw4-3y2]|uniref:hypothetical protein n=1 Tax=Bernardetia sp. Wsw4-3y2 TaxID=3127471 RepID=UPI0030CFE3A9